MQTSSSRTYKVATKIATTIAIAASFVFAGSAFAADPDQPSEMAVHQANQRLNAALPTLDAEQQQLIHRMSGEEQSLPGQRRSDELQALVKAEVEAQAVRAAAPGAADAPQAARTLTEMSAGRLPQYLEDALVMYGPDTSPAGGTAWRPDTQFLQATVDQALAARQLDRSALRKIAALR